MGIRLVERTFGGAPHLRFCGDAALSFWGAALSRWGYWLLHLSSFHFRFEAPHSRVGAIDFFTSPVSWCGHANFFHLQQSSHLKMAEYTTPATGAPANGAAMNGSSEQSFNNAAPMSTSSEAAKTLWYAPRTSLP